MTMPNLHFVDINLTTGIKPQGVNDCVHTIYVFDANVCIRLRDLKRYLETGQGLDNPALSNLLSVKDENSYYSIIFGVLELSTNSFKNAISDDMLEMYKDIAKYYNDKGKKIIYSDESVRQYEKSYLDAVPQTFLRFLIAQNALLKFPGGKNMFISRLEYYIQYHIDHNLKSLSSMHDLVIKIFMNHGKELGFLKARKKTIINSIRSSAVDIVHFRRSIDTLYHATYNTTGLGIPRIIFVSEENRLVKSAREMIFLDFILSGDKIAAGRTILIKPDDMSEKVWRKSDEILSKLQEHRINAKDGHWEDPVLIQSYIDELSLQISESSILEN